MDSDNNDAGQTQSPQVVKQAESIKWWQAFLRLNEWQGIGGVVAIVSLVVAIIALRPAAGSTAAPSSATRDPDLNVSFMVEHSTGANILIGNQGTSIIVVRDLALHWKYSQCRTFRKPTFEAQLVTYRYEADLTTSDGSKVLDTNEFKYSQGEVDKFLVDLRYPDYGVYTVWFTFDYTRLGENAAHTFTTDQDVREVCEKF